MYADDKAINITRIISKYSNRLETQLCSFLEFKECDQKNLDNTLKSYVANAVLTLCAEHKSYFLSYEDTLKKSNQSYKFVNNELVVIKPDIYEIEQVEADRKEYSFWSYNYKNEHRTDVFYQAAKILLLKLRINFEELSLQKFSFFLEKEFLLMEKEINRTPLESMEILYDKIRRF